jgi:hypothetical protein
VSPRMTPESALPTIDVNMKVPAPDAVREGAMGGRVVDGGFSDRLLLSDLWWWQLCKKWWCGGTEPRSLKINMKRMKLAKFQSTNAH